MHNHPRLKKRPLFRVTSGVLACLLASCGGGSHGILPHNGGGSTPQRASIKVVVTVPAPSSIGTRGRHLRRKLNYVSYSSAGLGINFVKHGAAFGSKTSPQYAADISLSSAQCTVTTSPARTCTFTIPIDSGHWDIQATLWDAAPVSGGFSGANELSQSVVSDQAVIAGETNAIGFTFDPVVAGVYLSLANTTLPASTTAPTTPTSLYVDLLDAAGNHIIGTDTLLGQNDNPLTLTLSSYDAPCNGISPRCSTQTATSFSATSLTQPPSAAITVSPGIYTTYSYITATPSGDTISGSNNAVTLTYTGIASQYDAGGLYGVVKALKGPDGRIYVFGFDSSYNGLIEVITKTLQANGTTTSSRTEVGLPASGYCPTDATVGRDGNIWYAETDCAATSTDLRLGYITTDSLSTGEFEVGTGNGASGITTDAAGNLWMTAPLNGAVFAANANTGSPNISAPVYLVPAPSAPASWVAASSSSSLPAGTYDVEVAYENAYGYSTPSASTEVTTANDNDEFIDVPCPPPHAGASSYAIFVQYNGGGFALQSSGLSLSGCTDAQLTSFDGSGVAPPATNTMTAPLALTIGPNGILWMTDQTNHLDVAPNGELSQFISADGPASIAALDANTMVYSDYIDGICTLSTGGGTPSCGAITSGANLSAGLVVAADGNIYYTEYRLGAAAIGSKQYGSLSTTTDYQTGFSPGFGENSLTIDAASGTLWTASNYNNAQNQATEMHIP